MAAASELQPQPHPADAIHVVLQHIESQFARAPAGAVTADVRTQITHELTGVERLLMDELNALTSSDPAASADRTRYRALLQRVRTLLARFAPTPTATSAAPVTATVAVSPRERVSPPTEPATAPVLASVNRKRSGSSPRPDKRTLQHRRSTELARISVTPTAAATAATAAASAATATAGAAAPLLSASIHHEPTHNLTQLLHLHSSEREKHNADLATAAAATAAAAAAAGTLPPSAPSAPTTAPAAVTITVSPPSPALTPSATAGRVRSRSASPKVRRAGSTGSQPITGTGITPIALSVLAGATGTGTSGGDPKHDAFAFDDADAASDEGDGFDDDDSDEVDITPPPQDAAAAAAAVPPPPVKRRKFWKRVAMRCVERYEHSKFVPGAALSGDNRNCCLTFSFAAPQELTPAAAAAATPHHNIDAECEKAFIYFFTKVRARNMRVANLILSFAFMLYALFSFDRDFNTPVLVARGVYIFIGLVFFCGSFSQFYRNRVQYYGLVLACLTGAELIVEGAIHRALFSAFLVILLIAYIVCWHTFVQVRFKFACIQIISFVVVYDIVALSAFHGGDDSVDASNVASWFAWYNVALIGVSTAILKAVHRAEGIMRDEFLTIYFGLLVTTHATHTAAATAAPKPAISTAPAESIVHSRNGITISTVPENGHPIIPTEQKEPAPTANGIHLHPPSHHPHPHPHPHAHPHPSAAHPPAHHSVSDYRWWKHKWDQLGTVLHSQFTSERVLAHIKKSGSTNMREFFDTFPENTVPTTKPAAAAAASGSAVPATTAVVAVDVKSSVDGDAKSAPAASAAVASASAAAAPVAVAGDGKSDAVPDASAAAAAVESDNKLKRLWKDFLQTVSEAAARVQATAKGIHSDDTAAPAPAGGAKEVDPNAPVATTELQRMLGRTGAGRKRVNGAGGGNPLTPKTPCVLCSLNELPAFFAGGYGPHVIKFYRINYDYWSALKSIFQLHNETVNVWTELGPFLIFIVLAINFFINDSVFTDANGTDKAILAIGLTGTLLLRPLCSAAAHTFHCQDERTFVFWWGVDYVSICIAVLCTSIVFGRLSFYCSPQQQIFYILSVCGLFCSTVISVLFIASPGVRVAAFVLFVVFASGVPFFFSVGTYTQWPALYLEQWAGSIAFIVFGLVLKATGFPECLAECSGKLDLFFASHQLWHLCINAGHLFLYLAWRTYFQWRVLPPNLCSA